MEFRYKLEHAFLMRHEACVLAFEIWTSRLGCLKAWKVDLILGPSLTRSTDEESGQVLSRRVGFHEFAIVHCKRNQEERGEGCRNSGRWTHRRAYASAKTSKYVKKGHSPGESKCFFNEVVLKCERMQSQPPHPM